MDDLISRQAAIDAIRDAENHAFNSFYKGLAKAHKIIADLPSVQPGVPDTNVGDIISRQAAIDAVKKNTFRLTFAEEQNCEGHVAWSAEAVYSDVMEGALLELPSAQPEQDVLAWLLAYHTKSFELHGRYFPHEVISWLVNDFSKEFIAERREE